jgi:hypothetical protein
MQCSTLCDEAGRYDLVVSSSVQISFHGLGSSDLQDVGGGRGTMEVFFIHYRLAGKLIRGGDEPCFGDVPYPGIWYCLSPGGLRDEAAFVNNSFTLW